MTPYQLYQYYLSNYQAPQSSGGGIMGVAPVAPIASFETQADGIASLAPSTTPGVPGKSISNVSISDIGKAIGFAMNPVAGIATLGFTQMTGKTPVQAVTEAISSFGLGPTGVSTAGSDSIAGTAADPSTMASEDPSGMGGTADSTAGTAADPGTMASEDPSGMGVGDSGSSSGSSKIVCTMMNESYGFGSFRNKIWLKHSKDLPKEYEKGYHKIFLPLVKYAKSDKFGSKTLKKILEHIAIHRTIDIKKEFKGQKHLLGRIYRKVLEPICYWVGKLND